MYATERHAEIAREVAASRRISVRETARRFGVTTETVRRDLDQLEREGVLRRVHGGAVPAGATTSFEPRFTERELVASGQKDAIALAALQLLPGARGSIILDAGTTTRALAARLGAATPLTVITNAPATAAIVLESPSVSVQMIGGRLRSSSQAAVGPQAVAALDALRVDVAFLGTNGLSLDYGLSTPDPDEAFAKAAMVRAGRRVVVLTDSSKFGEESLNRFAELSAIDVVVTDDGISHDDVAALEALDIDVVIA